MSQENWPISEILNAADFGAPQVQQSEQNQGEGYR